MKKVLFTLQIDCEATQHAINDAALGERSIRGLGEILQQTSTKGTFMVIPGDVEIHTSIYRDLENAGHEIGLHLHPADLGYDEFLGVQSGEMQLTMIHEAADRFAQVMGRLPKTFCPGYASANDHTFGVLEALGFTHGMVSIPTRQLAQCASLWAGAPLDPHYPHRYNRCLTGDVNFVELPPTVDPDSRMWGGLHPQDLRVELVDAKNHWYTMHKAVTRQLTEDTPLCQLHAMTHNVFDFSEPQNFRRETYLKMTEAAKRIAEENQLVFEPSTLNEMAENYRDLVPLEDVTAQRLELDARGRAFHSK